MKKPNKLAMQVAARCWCDDETSAIEMDARLAMAFAKRLDLCLDLLQKAREAHWTNAPYLEIEKLLNDFEKGVV